jgi:pimeloyl-ACP methyl ester carboxylesterase
VDLATLRAAQPDLLEKAAGSWQSAAGRLRQISEEFSEQTGPLFTISWAGVAADAASPSLSALLGQLTAAAADMDAMAAVYRDAAMGVSGAQAILKAAQDLAAANGLAIGPGGEVSTAVPSLPGPLRRMAEEEAADSALPPAAGEVASLVTKALRLAGEVDSQVSAQIARLPGPASAVAAVSGLAAELGHEMMPPAGMSPKQINEWWTALDAAAQQELIQDFPGRVGWLNGLPATARDQANRLAMKEAQESLSRQLASLQRHEPPDAIFDGIKVGWVSNPAAEQWAAQVSQIQNELWGISALAGSLARCGKNGIPQAYLLGFGLSGNGQAIVAYGNPDTAATTVTYVPGTGASLNMSGADAGNALALWQQAHKLNPGQSLSSIYWLDYNAPQINSLSGYLNLASPAAAQAGAPSLAGFQSGLAAAHAAGVPSRTVLIGHSYGSLVVGEAAVHNGVHPSDLVLVGSPGVGVSTASDLGISPSHVWAGANINDPVPDIPPDVLAKLPDIAEGAVVGGIGGLLTHGLSGIKPGAEAAAAGQLLMAHLEAPDASYFGTNPATPPFGANDFSADYVPGEPSKFDMSYWQSFHAHTTYWSQGSASLRNMAAIVAGKYGQVTLAGSGSG